MTTTLDELKAETIEDPEVTADHERLASATEGSGRWLRAAHAAATRQYRREWQKFTYAGGKREAQLDRRAWRAATRTTRPLSTKVRHPGGKVDVAPAPKKGRGK